MELTELWGRPRETKHVYFVAGTMLLELGPAIQLGPWDWPSDTKGAQTRLSFPMSPVATDDAKNRT